MGRTCVVPLGGLGEVGLNSLLLESGGDGVLVDCGLLFPQERELGIDRVVPDFSALRRPGRRLLAVLVTHGHEDHTGALPELLREFPVPVYGTRIALGLLERRLAENAPGLRSLLRPVTPGDRVAAGPFRAEFIRVTHSIPDACALGLETPGGTVFHTGDFKFDPGPVDGRPTDRETLAAWGDQGVDLLLCDSTGAETPGRTASERAVGDALRSRFPEITGRAYVTTFASHLHRIQQVVEVSRNAGRQVAVLGRSVTESVRLARRLGYLKVAPGDLVPASRARRLDRNRLTVVLGGSQGEPGSALWRVAHGREEGHRVEPGDGVFLSARVIPGRETRVHRLVDRCLRLGARVHWGGSVHASGHPSGGDVAEMLALIRPRHVVPVHGELHHLEALARAAERWGVPAAGVFRLENGQSLVLEGGSLRPGGLEPVGRVYVDAGEAAGEGLLAERRRLGRSGVAVVAVVLGERTGAVVGTPGVRLVGVVPEHRREAVARALRAELRRALTRQEPSTPPDTGSPVPEREGAAARAVRRYFRRTRGKIPEVICQVTLVAEPSEPDAGAPVDSPESTPLQ